MNESQNITHRGNVVMIIAVCVTALLCIQMNCDPKDDGLIAEPFSIVYVSQRDGIYYIYKMKSDGSDKKRLTELEEKEGRPKWAPNRLEIVFVRGGNIWRMNSDGSNERQLTSDGINNCPIWSPDGQLIAYSSGYNQIKIIDRDGNNIEEIGTCIYSDFAWSLDGTMIAYTNTTFGEWHRIEIFNIDTKESGSFGSYHYHPVWSPDSKDVAYRVGERGYIGKREVNLDDMDNQEEHVIIGFYGGGPPASYDSKIIWSPYYNKIVYLEYIQGFINIFMVNTDDKEKRQITDNEFYTISGCDWDNSLGTSIVFCGCKWGENDDIYTIYETSEGFKIEPLTESESGYDGMPDW